MECRPLLLVLHFYTFVGCYVKGSLSEKRRVKYVYVPAQDSLSLSVCVFLRFKKRSEATVQQIQGYTQIQIGEEVVQIQMQMPVGGTYIYP